MTAAEPRKCRRCGHVYDAHAAGVTGRCVNGTCECPWFKVDARTGR